MWPRGHPCSSLHLITNSSKAELESIFSVLLGIGANCNHFPDTSYAESIASSSVNNGLACLLSLTRKKSKFWWFNTAKINNMWCWIICITSYEMGIRTLIILRWTSRNLALSFRQNLKWILHHWCVICRCGLVRAACVTRVLVVTLQQHTKLTALNGPAVANWGT